MRRSALRRDAGVTLMEVLIAVTLLSLLSVGMLFAIRIGLSTFGKTNDKLMYNRRVAGAQRILEQELQSLIPVVSPCGTSGLKFGSSRARNRRCGWCRVFRCKARGAGNRRSSNCPSFQSKTGLGCGWS
jgi:prepilin-type N-terminal cleavage/methylation domain-containing protein